MFLFSILFKTNYILILTFSIFLMFRKDMQDWYTWFKMSFQKCPEALEWFINYITDDVHAYIVCVISTHIYISNFIYYIYRRHIDLKTNLCIIQN